VTEIELDPKGLEKAFHAIVNVWDEARGIDPNLSDMAAAAIRAYLLAGGVGAEPVAWRSVVNDPPVAVSALARFFDSELGEWVYTVFDPGPVNLSMSAPYSEWLPLDTFNRPLYASPSPLTAWRERLLQRLIYCVDRSINARGWELREEPMLEEAVRFLLEEGPPASTSIPADHVVVPFQDRVSEAKEIALRLREITANYDAIGEAADFLESLSTPASPTVGDGWKHDSPFITQVSQPDGTKFVSVKVRDFDALHDAHDLIIAAFQKAGAK